MLRSKSGSAIIIVLIVSIIAMSLTLFAVGVSKRIVQSSDMLMDKLNAEFGVESAVEKLKFYVSTGKFSSLYVENDYKIGFPAKIYIDSRVQKIDNNTTLKVQDTGGLMGVWTINKKLIKSILLNDNVSETRISEISDSLEDWYDRDNLRHLNGAEKEYYKLEGDKFTPRNFNGVQSIYEWRIIRGFDKKIFDYIKKYLVLSTNWHPNINTMPAIILSSALNIPLSEAQTLVEIRKSKNNLTQTDIKRVLGSSFDTFEYGTFPTFVLDINAQYKFNMSMKRITCTISFKADNSTPYRILKWQN